ncbi:MAG: c-type cytochrome [Phycisphaerales bacterium]|nr:c-type cytochrome [Phycisphaerales bacterium]
MKNASAGRFVRRLGVCAVLAALAGSASGQDAEWIWVSPQAKAGQHARMLRLFMVSGEVDRAQLVATCDNHMVVYVNGEEVARSDTWESPVAVDVAGKLRQGRNVVAVDALNDGGAAGLALRLDVTLKSGEKSRVVSSGDWRASEEAPEGWEQPGFAFRAWERAASLGSTTDGSLPWGVVMQSREATPAAAIHLPDGFAVELVHSSQAGEGSWVSLTMDPEGRALVSPESGGLLRLTRTGPESATVEREPVDIGMCQGLLLAYDSLYASVNENADRKGGLHRLRDTNGDGLFDTDEQLASYPYQGEHGPHGLVLGPDGMIYTVHGNHTPLMLKVDKAHSPLRDWAEDLLLPRIWDPRGHAVGIKSPAGVVLRTDKDGQHWEVIAGGLRNSYDIAFAPNGELFTYDSDMEWDIGTPWYRPPRVVHLVEGGEYGWRGGTGKWPDYYPDSLPPVLDTDLASPVGVTFPSGGMFPEPWASALFIGDWAYGRIAAVHLTPKGASYSGVYETFALGLPMSVTDIAFAPDGSMWFTTGGRGTQSGLYRVTYAGDKPGAEGAALAGLTEEAVLRRKLEHIGPDDGPAGLAEAVGHLGDPDRFVRYAARLAMERFGFEEWVGAVVDAPVEAQPQCAIAVARHEDKLNVDRAVEFVTQYAKDLEGTEDDLAYLRAIEIACARGGEPSEATRQAVLDKFDSAFPSEDPHLAHILAEVLTYFRAPGIGPRLLEIVEHGATREEKIYAALCLRLVVDQLDASGQDRYFGWLRQARNLPGGASFTGFMQAIEKEAVEHLDGDSKARVVAELAAMDKEAPVSPAPPNRPFVRQWDLAGAAKAVSSMGGERSVARGARLFTEARCIECHRFGGAGGATGPDLTGVARRFSREDLLQAVVEPSKVVSDQYRASIVTLKDGRQLNGRLIQITGGRMDVLTDPFTHAVTSVSPGDIEKVEESLISPMPAGLLDTMSAAEIADLLAYLESGAAGAR